jgi:hypothetical protein
MLLGSVPVIFLIAPCVLAGALLLRADEDGSWVGFFLYLWCIIDLTARMLHTGRGFKFSFVNSNCGAAHSDASSRLLH